MRFKFTLTFIAIISISIVSGGIFVTQMSRRERLSVIDERLRGAAEDLVRFFDDIDNPDRAEDWTALVGELRASQVLWILGHSDQPRSVTPKANVEALRLHCGKDGWTTYRTDDYLLRCYSENGVTPSSRVVVGSMISLKKESAFTARRLWLELPLLIGLGIAASLILVKAYFKPLRDLSEIIEALVRDHSPDSLVRLRQKIEGKFGRTRFKDEFYQLSLLVASFLSKISEAFSQQSTSGAKLAHEVNTPLTLIVNRIEELERLGSQPKPRDLEFIKAQALALSSFVRDFSEWSESNLLIQQPAQMSALDVREVMEQLVDRLRPLYSGEVYLSIAPNAGSIIANRHDLEHIIQNLFTNSARYGEPERGLWIEAQKGEISLSDHGPGIPPEVIAKFGKPFNRGPRQSRIQGSSGLGLAIVASLAARYGWTVEFTTAEPKGQRVTIRFTPA